MGIEVEDQCLINLLFVDDQVIIANAKHDIDFMIRKLTEECMKWELNIDGRNVKVNINNKIQQGKKLDSH